MKAYEILQGCTSPANRYKLALLCIKLNRHEEAERALLNKKPSGMRQLREDVENVVPNGAAGHYLLGLIYQKRSRDKEASAHFIQALKLNPTLWCAFEKLTAINPDINLDVLFQSDKGNIPTGALLSQNQNLKQANASEVFHANLGVAQYA
jgi:anaphase-promoting complex subunit 3